MANNLGVPGDKSPSRLSSSSISLAEITQDFGLQIRIAIIAISTISIFFQDIYITGSEALASDYYNYVLVIPFLSAYLIYRERKLLSAVIPLRDDNGRVKLNLAIRISALLVALIIYLYGSSTTYAIDYHLIALEIFLGASILLLFNRRTLRLLIVPILLLTAALPSLTQFGLSFWLAMSWISVVPAQWLLHSIGLNVTIASPTANIPTLVLSTASGATYSFAVGVASSGIYSVIGFTLFAAFLVYISKGNLWKKVALLVSAYPLLLLVNILREVILVYVANIWGNFAFNVFHATSGIVLVFIVTFFLIMLGDRALKLSVFPSRITQKSCSVCDQEYRQGHNFCANCGKFLQSVSRRISSRDVYAIAALFIIVVLFLVSLAPAVASANAPSNIPIQSISANNADSLLPQIPGWNLSFVYRDTYVQEVLEQDAALVYTYTQHTNGTGNPTLIYVTIQVSAGIHTPESSLIVYPILFGQSGVRVLTDNDIQILSQPFLVGTFFTYQQSNSTDAYIYWNTRAVFNFGSYSDFRNVQISIWQDTDALTASGALPNSTDLAGIKQLYLPLARSIALFWQPLSSNSVIQSVFQRWSVPLLGLTVFPAIIVGGQSSIEKRRESRANGKVFGKLLTSQNRSLLESLKLAYTEKGSWLGRKKLLPPTVEQILAVHKGRTGEDISPIDAVKELTYLEHFGFVKRDIVSDSSDEPIQVWKVIVPTGNS